jgi:hypothetical protein
MINKNLEDNAKKIFPITIFKTKIKNNNELKDLLVPNIINNSQYLNIPNEWTTHKVKTSFSGEPKGLEILYNDSPYQKILFRNYSECMDKIFDRDYEILIPKIWYNVYLDGEYQEQHDHLGTPLNPCHFSCIHFLSYNPAEHSPPQFIDPLSQLRNLSIELDRNNYGEIYVPKIEEGDLLMFPSYLLHSVLPCKKTDYPRITISFNITVTKYDND